MVTQVTSFGRSGLSDWLVQRGTAIVLLAYMLCIIANLVCIQELTFEAWSALFDTTWMKAFSTLAVLAIVVHAWIGLWAVSTDYMTTRLMGARATAVRLAFQTAYSLVLFYYLVWGLQVFWG